MKVDWPVEIAGVGVGIPDRVIDNQHFVSYLDTTDEWIVTRTGVRERRWCREGETLRELAVAASHEALREARVDGQEIDLILLGTVTSEFHLPATACALQRDLGCRPIPAFDVSASCAGFIFGFASAVQFIVAGTARTALVVGGDVLSRIVDVQDRATCFLFGDGAGAVVLRKATRPGKGVIAVNLATNGQAEKLIWVPAGGSRDPASQRTVNERLHYIRMAGREVYKFAVVALQDLITDTLDEAGVKIDDLALLVPHQSNLRMIESVADKLSLPMSRVVVNIDRYGNTSGGSVPIALYEARRDGRVKDGDLVMMIAMGAGLAWGAILLRV